MIQSLHMPISLIPPPTDQRNCWAQKFDDRPPGCTRSAHEFAVPGALWQPDSNGVVRQRQCADRLWPGLHCLLVGWWREGIGRKTLVGTFLGMNYWMNWLFVRNRRNDPRNRSPRSCSPSKSTRPVWPQSPWMNRCAGCSPLVTICELVG